MPTYTLTDTAQADLDEIQQFYRSITSEAVSNRRIGQLYFRFELLAAFPNMGMARSNDVSGLRSYVVPRTTLTILYFPRPEYLEIVRIIFGSRGIERAIQ
jgi:toxin ParE1/3/4